MNDELELVKALAPSAERPPSSTIEAERSRLRAHIAAQEGRSRRPRTRGVRAPRRNPKLAGALAFSLILLVITVGLIASVLAEGDDAGHYVSRASRNAVAELLTPVTPRDYERSIGNLQQFEAEATAAITKRCLEAKSVQLFSTGTAGSRTHAPSFEDPTLLASLGFDSVVGQVDPIAAQATPPGVDQAELDECSRIGESAAASLRNMLAPSIDAWTRRVVSIDHSAQLSAAIGAWRNCMTDGGYVVAWPEDVYSRASELGRNTPAQTELARVFAGCLDDLSSSRTKARSRERTGFVAARNFPQKAALSAELHRLSQDSGVPVPSLLSSAVL